MPNLIGTGTSQVPTNGMLGGLAYQSPDNAVIRNLELTNLSGHNSVIPSNAVDVFVYDTRKDSDGGQWRKRTQHTSWYNETLNTATRGSRRDFPAVAVLVLESSRLIIYDGDDPDMSMWMVFNTTDGSMLRSGVMTSIVMMNGEFWVGHDSGSGLHWVNFLKDTARWLTASTAYGGFFKKGSIIFRNDAGANYDNNVGGASDIIIAGSSIKDVAMTVLPNAPINSTTGLPVPTIAVATDSGVSVIKDDGTVVDITNGNSAFSYPAKIDFSGNKKDLLYWVYGYLAITDDTHAVLINIPSSDFVTSENHTNSINSGYNSTILSPPFILNYPNAGGTLGNVRINSSKNNLFAGNVKGLSNLLLNNNSELNSMVSQISSSYNTGWMHGDIKGAWLSDTSTASVTGTELVTNGTFAGNLNGWTLAGDTTPTYDSASGGAKITTGTSVDGQINQTITSTTGVVVTFSITARTSGFVGLALNGTLVLDGLTALQSYTYYSDSTITSVGLVHRGGGGGYAIVDNVSVRKTEKDRSVNNKGLAVYGTITKSPVATGSNLVAYSGWSNSNYLRRPSGVTNLNNSSITYMCWYKGGGYNGEEAPVSTGDYNLMSQVRGIYINPSGIAGFSGWANDFNPGSFNVRDYVWHHICVTIQYISGTTYTISVYVDGRLTGSTNRELSTFTNTAIDVGGGTLPGTRYTIGSLSLVRVSTTIPSSEQIRKIYEDEKVLFQPNSQCTLYGSSDAVTALAYDDAYQILSVGTSSGRSDFRGLERINNTTTAVTTAISASNGLIAEQ